MWDDTVNSYIANETFEKQFFSDGSIHQPQSWQSEKQSGQSKNINRGTRGNKIINQKKI